MPEIVPGESRRPELIDVRAPRQLPAPKKREIKPEGSRISLKSKMRKSTRRRSRAQYERTMKPKWEIDEATDAATDAHRPLTVYEKRVDFGRSSGTLNGLEEETKESLLEILTRQREKILASIEKRSEGPGITISWIKSFALPYGIEFSAVMRDFLRSGFDLGRSDATVEIGKQRRQKSTPCSGDASQGCLPGQVSTCFSAFTFWIKNVLFDGLVKTIQALLNQRP